MRAEALFCQCSDHEYATEGKDKLKPIYKRIILKLSGEALASLGDVALVLDEADLPPELDGRKQGGLLVADFIDEIVYSGHAVKIPTNLRNYFHKSCPSYD